MKELMEYLENDNENKFFSGLDSDGLFITSYTLKNQSIVDAKKICKQINQLLTEFKEGKREKELIKYTHWLWKQRFAELVGSIGINKVVKKYLINSDG